MQAESWDQPLLVEELCTAMVKRPRFVGLGQAAPNPIKSILKYFPKEI